MASSAGVAGIGTFHGLVGEKATLTLDWVVVVEPLVEVPVEPVELVPVELVPVEVVLVDGVPVEPVPVDDPLVVVDLW